MSLKLVKQSLKARPSKMSFISDFEDSDSFQNQASPPEMQKLNYFQDFEEPTKPEEGGNEPTILQSNSDKSPEINTFTCDSLGLQCLSVHCKQKIDKILSLYHAGNLRKMRRYLEGLSIYSSNVRGSWTVSEEVYSDFQCFDVGEGPDGRAMGFVNKFTSIDCLMGVNDMHSEKGVRNILSLVDDCYSAILSPSLPFQNSLVVGVFSGSLNFIDLAKEKTVKKIKVTAPVCHITQENTLIFAGDVMSGVLCCDYRMKNPYGSVKVAEEKNGFEPVLYVEKHEDFILAGNKAVCRIWDLRNTGSSVFEYEFKEKKTRKVGFLGVDQLIFGEVGSNKANILNLQNKKMSECYDFKKKGFKDMVKVKGKGEKTVWLVENEKAKSEIYCCDWNEKKRRMRVDDWMSLDANFDRVKVGDGMRVLGVMGKEELRLIGWKERGVEALTRGKLKSVIGKNY